MTTFDWRRLGKLLVMVLLAGGVTVSAFIAGMVFYATTHPAAPAPGPVTSLSLVEGGDAAQNGETMPAAAPAEFATFWEAWSFLEKQFYGPMPADSERVYGAIKGMVASFDDQHTAFVDPTRAAILNENIKGSFEGIGASVRLDETGRLIIADAYPDRPAFTAGLRPGDVVLQVDGEPIQGLNLYEAVLLIRGPADSQVVLTILRPDEPEPFDVTVIRARIDLQVVQAKMLASHVGYVRLTQFSSGASAKLAQAMEELLGQGATSIVLDLRGNPGGLLSEAVNVGGLFLADGAVVIEKLKGGEEKVFDARGGQHTAVGIPLAVLVNGGSASASEIVAGAIQDHKRGTIIGETSFGKGSVQLPHTLSDGSELRVTIAEWLTPNRRQINGEGIIPDLAVEQTAEDMAKQLDPQLDAAVRFLDEQVSQ